MKVKLHFFHANSGNLQILSPGLPLGPPRDLIPSALSSNSGRRWRTPWASQGETDLSVSAEVGLGAPVRRLQGKPDKGKMGEAPNWGRTPGQRGQCVDVSNPIYLSLCAEPLQLNFYPNNDTFLTE